MQDPIQRFKRLPWRSLFLAAALTATVVLLLDVSLLLAVQVPALRPLLQVLFTPPLGTLLLLGVAVGIGALAVGILERIDRSITTGSLWALVLCLAIVFLLKGFLPIPTPLFQLDELRLVALLLGVFWKGRPYWQSFSRW